MIARIPTAEKYAAIESENTNLLMAMITRDDGTPPQDSLILQVSPVLQNNEVNLLFEGFASEDVDYLAPKYSLGSQNCSRASACL